MKNNDFFSFKFLNQYFIRRKEKELKRLDINKEKLSESIENEKEISEIYTEHLQKEQEENLLLKKQYDKVKDAVVNRGIILDIENNNYDIKEWDNLFLYKNGTKFSVVSKKQEDLYVLDNYMNGVLEQFSSANYSFSVVVIRVTKKIIKAQIRFVKK